MSSGYIRFDFLLRCGSGTLLFVRKQEEESIVAVHSNLAGSVCQLNCFDHP